MPRSLAQAKRRRTEPTTQAATAEVPEPVVAKTVKLPRSLDDRLRQFCASSRRTGQDVMQHAILEYLNRKARPGAA